MCHTPVQNSRFGDEASHLKRVDEGRVSDGRTAKLGTGVGIDGHKTVPTSCGVNLERVDQIVPDG